MLVMRIDNVTGMCELTGYDEDKFVIEGGGWFPIESYSFRFPSGQNPFEQTRAAAPGARPAAGTAGRTATGQRPAAESPANAAQQQRYAEMDITKPMDTATCNLMHLAMHERGRRGQAESQLSADIHYVGTVSRGKEVKQMSTFTFFLIHLEKVAVQSWNISATADGRPNETLTLRYEKAAVCYRGMEDGVATPIVQGGWDQAQWKVWEKDEIKSKYFPVYPKE